MISVTPSLKFIRARTLYTLATSFQLPPTSVSSLQQSIEKYKTAISLTNSPLLMMDATFNCAQALSSLADMVEDLPRLIGGGLEIDSLRREARDSLQDVMDGQEEYLRASLAASADSDAREESEVLEEVIAEEGGQGEHTDGDRDMDVEPADAEASGTDETTTATFETHLPTPSILIDTALALVEINLSLWESVTPPQTPSDESQTQVRLILDRAAQFSSPGRQAELDLAEIKVLLCLDGIVWELFKSQADINSGFDKSLQGATMALGALLTSLDSVPPDEESVRADILTTLAETHSSIARRLVSISASSQLPPGPSPLAQSAWFNLGQCITHLTTALNLSSSPTPTTTSSSSSPNTPMPKEYRPSVLLSLSKASLARARLANINETAKRNSSQLIENASAYAAQAGEALGWGFVRLGPGPTSAPIATLPYPRGWEAELLARNVMLQQMRVCYYAFRTELVPTSEVERKAKFEQGYKGLGSIGFTKLEKGRQLGKEDVERWQNEIEVDEGSLSDEERTRWTEVIGDE